MSVRSKYAWLEQLSSEHGYGPWLYDDHSGALCSSPGNGSGAFVHSVSLHHQDFRDGLGNTVFFSERVIGDGDGAVYDPWRDYFRYEGRQLCTVADTEVACRSAGSRRSKHASWMGHTWFYGGFVHTWYNHLNVPNSTIADCASDDEAVSAGGSGAFSARSMHPSGVNAACGDGSCRLIDQSIDVRVWRSISTRAGRDIVAW